jgi:hypothetical protein
MGSFNIVTVIEAPTTKLWRSTVEPRVGGNLRTVTLKTFQKHERLCRSRLPMGVGPCSHSTGPLRLTLQLIPKKWALSCELVVTFVRNY